MPKNKGKMKKELFLISFALIFLISIISAQPPFTEVGAVEETLNIFYPPYLYIETGQNFTLNIHVTNATGAITNATGYCKLELYDNLGVHSMQNNLSYDADSEDFYIFVEPGNFSTNSIKSFFIQCRTPNEIGSVNGAYEVNPTGGTLEDYQMNLFIMIFIMLFVILSFAVYGINKAVKGEWQIFYICLAYILLFSMFFLLWLVSQNYLYDIPLLESVFWIIWIILGGLFFPFIIFVSSYILKKQAEKLLEDDYVSQGYTREEAREMSKRRR